MDQFNDTKRKNNNGTEYWVIKYVCAPIEEEDNLSKSTVALTMAFPS